MAKKLAAKPTAAPRLKSSSLLDTRVIYCGDNLEQLAKLPDACIDLIYIAEPQNRIARFEADLALAQETSDRRREGRALFNLAISYALLKDHAQAIVHAEDALQIFEDIKDSAAIEVRKKLSEWRNQRN